MRRGRSLEDVKRLGLAVALLVASCTARTIEGVEGSDVSTSGPTTTSATPEAPATSAMPEPPEPSTSPEFGSTGDDADPSTRGSGIDTSESSSTGEGFNEPEARDVVWTNAQITPGCFLFVDTQTLGTAVTWIEADGQVILRFDAARHIDFVGPADATPLRLTSEDSDVYMGDTWAFTQEFVGMLEDGRYVGTWSYTECNMTQAPELCPADGGCTGTANFEMTIP